MRREAEPRARGRRAAEPRGRRGDEGARDERRDGRVAAAARAQVQRDGVQIPARGRERRRAVRREAPRAEQRLDARMLFLERARAEHSC